MDIFKRSEPDAELEHARRAGAAEQREKDGSTGVGVRNLIQDRDVDVRHAYDRGRRDERARRVPRRGSPLLTIILLLAAAAGAGVIYLGVSQGSFARGGQVIDQSLGNAGQSTQNVTHAVAAKAGSALQNAGAKLKGAPQPSGAQTNG